MTEIWTKKGKTLFYFTVKAELDRMSTDIQYYSVKVSGDLFMYNCNLAWTALDLRHFFTCSLDKKGGYQDKSS